MSEHFSQHNHERDEGNHFDFLENFDVSTLVGAEEHAQIRAQVEQAHTERAAAKSEQSQQALEDVHKLFEQSDESAPRTVLFEGKQEQVVDSYTDARGNEWVSFADGRQTMKHQEVAASATEPAETVNTEALAGFDFTKKEAAPVVDTEVLDEFDFTKPDEAPIEVNTEAIQGYDFAKPEAEAEPDPALAAATAHLEEVVRRKESSVEATEQPDISAPESVAEPGNEQTADTPAEEAPKSSEEKAEQAEAKSIEQQAAMLSARLAKAAESHTSARRGVDKYVTDTVAQLADLRARLNRTENRGIDPILFGRIDQALEQSKRTVSAATNAETKKMEMVRGVRQLVMNSPEGILPDKQEAVESLMRLPAESGREGFLRIQSLLGKANARDYARDKSGLVKELTYIINSLQAQQNDNRSDNRFGDIVKTLR